MRKKIMPKYTKMTFIINTSNLYVGGGLQVALSFLAELKQISRDHAYHVFLSSVVNLQIDQKSFPNNFYFYPIEKSPASLKTRSDVLIKLDTLEKQIKPDLVFTIFGPSYWRPKSLHLMGFAMPWLINPQSSAFKQLSLIELIKSKIRQQYSAYHIARNADYYFTETEDTKSKLCKVVAIDDNKVFVVGNTVNAVFDDINPKVFDIRVKESDEFWFITISHNYRHKNLQIIRKLIPYLQNMTIKIRFFVTLDSKSYKYLFDGLETYIINLGPVKVDDCPSIYNQCDAMFLPTLLECFSASYPEAMKMGKPILTSNYSFATDVCGDAALYFDPLDPKDIAEKITQLIENRELYNDLVKKGNERLLTFETAKSRAEKYVAICEDIVKASDES